ncbi:MAG: hypothetical protein ACYS1A_15990 [Planctomycetota bacterium]
MAKGKLTYEARQRIARAIVASEILALNQAIRMTRRNINKPLLRRRLK